MNIADFIDQYWPAPFSELDNSDAQKEREKRFGIEAVQKQHALEQFITRSQTDYQTYNDYMLSTGMYAYANPSLDRRSRELLRVIIPAMERTTATTLLDLGSGDGRIAIGIAKYVSLIRRVICVDESAVALQLARQHAVKQLPGESGKIILVKGDYRHPTTQQAIRQKRKGRTTGLFAFPNCNYPPAFHLLAQTMRTGEEAFLCYEPEAEYVFTRDGNEHFMYDEAVRNPDFGFSTTQIALTSLGPRYLAVWHAVKQ
jgi:hypothetical protein